MSFTLAFLLSTSSLLATELVPVENKALILTHTTEKYHTSSDTILFTNTLISSFLEMNREVIALAEFNPQRDVNWYSKDFSKFYLSTFGEHALTPKDDGSESFEITMIGGYHGACLGWSVARFIQRFVQNSAHVKLRVNLPLAAIYTGFLFDENGELRPSTPTEETWLDDSVDGLPMLSVMNSLSSEYWLAFLDESIFVGILENNPLSHQLNQQLEFRILRDGILLKKFIFKPSLPPPLVRKMVELNYSKGDGALCPSKSW